jgi:uncharacterized protein
MERDYEWDTDKAESNRRKHGVSFEEAETVFDDELLETFPDTRHSDDEERYISIGVSKDGRLLIVIHTDRDEVVRIISCREATTAERRAYERGDFGEGYN